MTELERQFWLRIHRRITGLTPDVEAAIVQAFKIIRDALDVDTLARLIASGDLDRVFAEVLNETLMDRAMFSIRQRIRRVADRAFTYTVPDLPKGGMIDGTLAIRFDYLNPKVIDAIRSIETEATATLKADVREIVRAFVENGLRDGVNPTATARLVRGYVGLAPNQARYVENLRAELESGEFATAERRVLLDRRFNLTKLESLSGAERAKRIDTIVEAYRKKWIATNANVNAKAMALDSYKTGQALAWQDAIDKGVVPDGSRLMQTWVHFDPQPDPRPIHQAMGFAHETVPFGSRFSNGQIIPGLGDYNCKCFARYWVQRAA